MQEIVAPQDSAKDEKHLAIQNQALSNSASDLSMHVSVRATADQTTPTSSVYENLEQSILGKRRRKRRQCDLATYQQEIFSTIDKLKEQMLVANKNNDIKESRRIKNLISAYESRLLKRAKDEDTQAQIDVRAQQLATILKIIQQELPSCESKRIFKRIEKETPRMQKWKPE